MADEKVGIEPDFEQVPDLFISCQSDGGQERNLSDCQLKNS
jgi:hypothetical protein